MNCGFYGNSKLKKVTTVVLMTGVCSVVSQGYGGKDHPEEGGANPKPSTVKPRIVLQEDYFSPDPSSRASSSSAEHGLAPSLQESIRQSCEEEKAQADRELKLIIKVQDLYRRHRAHHKAVQALLGLKRRVVSVILTAQSHLRSARARSAAWNAFFEATQSSLRTYSVAKQELLGATERLAELEKVSSTNTPRVVADFKKKIAVLEEDVEKLQSHHLDCFKRFEKLKALHKRLETRRKKINEGIPLTSGDFMPVLYAVLKDDFRSPDISNGAYGFFRSGGVAESGLMIRTAKIGEDIYSVFVPDQEMSQRDSVPGFGVRKDTQLRFLPVWSDEDRGLPELTLMTYKNQSVAVYLKKLEIGIEGGWRGVMPPSDLPEDIPPTMFMTTWMARQDGRALFDSHPVLQSCCEVPIGLHLKGDEGQCGEEHGAGGSSSDKAGASGQDSGHSYTVATYYLSEDGEFLPPGRENEPAITVTVPRRAASSGSVSHKDPQNSQQDSGLVEGDFGDSGEEGPKGHVPDRPSCGTNSDHTQEYGEDSSEASSDASYDYDAF